MACSANYHTFDFRFLHGMQALEIHFLAFFPGGSPLSFASDSASGSPFGSSCLGKPFDEELMERYLKVCFTEPRQSPFET